MMLERATTLDQLWSGDTTHVDLRGVPVLLLRLGDEVHAYEDRCPHAAFPLSKGRLCGRTLACGAHAWEFDAATGQGVNPAGACLTRFRVELCGRDVLVDVAAGEGRRHG